jgi:putative flippase GtrA
MFSGSFHRIQLRVTQRLHLEQPLDISSRRCVAASSAVCAFVLVNVVGLVLNQIILFVVNNLLTAGRPEAEKGWEPLIAFGIATGIVVFWNFLANKHWTFKTT